VGRTGGDSTGTYELALPERFRVSFFPDFKRKHLPPRSPSPNEPRLFFALLSSLLLRTAAHGKLRCQIGGTCRLGRNCHVIGQGPRLVAPRRLGGTLSIQFLTALFESPLGFRHPASIKCKSFFPLRPEDVMLFADSPALRFQDLLRRCHCFRFFSFPLDCALPWGDTFSIQTILGYPTASVAVLGVHA